jgi:hypothetical protein
VHTDPLHLAALLAAGTLAGAINSIAGGGSLLTFPTLLALGASPITANATNTVALIPGSAAAFWGYRDTLSGARDLTLAMALPSAVGGVLGAWLALRVGDATFARLVPWLILAATMLFALQGPIARRMAAGRDFDAPRTMPLPLLVLFQLGVATYGGFFGAGIGILMLAALGLVGVRDVHRANGLKNLAAVCINGVAAIAFISSGRVAWLPALAIGVGAIAGGYSGAGVARKVGQARVRQAVLAIGIGLTVVMFARTFG